MVRYFNCGYITNTTLHDVTCRRRIKDEISFIGLPPGQNIYSGVSNILRTQSTK